MQQWINFKTTWVQQQVCLKRKEILLSLLLIIQSLYIIKIAMKWISLNEGKLNLCFTLSSSMCLSRCFEATEPREPDPFSYLTHKKGCFRRLAWRMFWEERSEISRRASTPFCRPATHRPIWGPTSGAAPAQNIHPNVCPTCLGHSFDTTFHV